MTSTRPRRVAGTPQNYFISFTDLLVGLLFIFILLMMTYALNTKSAQQALQAKVEGLEGRITQRDTLLTDIVAEMKMRGYDGLQAPPREGVLRFQSELLFKRSNFTLNEKAQKLLDQLAEVMAEKIPCYVATYRADRCPKGGSILEAVYVEGHTDNEPFNREIDGNWGLSFHRAHVTYDRLTNKSLALATMTNASGQPLLSVSAYAETRPVSSDPNKNRRIDIRFLLASPTAAELEEAKR